MTEENKILDKLSEQGVEEAPTGGFFEPIYSDYFEVETDLFDASASNLIVLPKYSFSSYSKFATKHDQTKLIMAFPFHTPGLPAAILKAIGIPSDVFIIRFFDPDYITRTLSTWKFIEARITDVDFGYIALSRKKPAELAIEVGFKSLKIDDADV